MQKRLEVCAVHNYMYVRTCTYMCLQINFAIVDILSHNHLNSVRIRILHVHVRTYSTTQKK